MGAELYQYIDGTTGALAVAIRDGGQLARQVRAACVDRRGPVLLSVRGDVSIQPGRVVVDVAGRMVTGPGYVTATPAARVIVEDVRESTAVRARHTLVSVTGGWSEVVLRGVQVRGPEGEMWPAWAPLVALTWDDVPVEGGAA